MRLGRAAALLALLAGSARADPWVRTQPQTLRAGRPTGAAPICREVAPYARRLTWDLPPSADNEMNCGAGGGASSSYVLPADPSQPYEMHVISAGGGSFPSPTGDPTAPDRSVQVVVYKTRKPAVLVLAARDPVLWDVTVTPRADLAMVILQGRGTQILRGVPEDVPVVKRTWDQACAWAHAWEPRLNLAGPDLPLMVSSLRCATGLRESSFQGCSQGALFEVPSYREEDVPPAKGPWTPPCALPVSPDVPLAGVRSVASAGAARAAGAAVEADATPVADAAPAPLPPEEPAVPAQTPPNHELTGPEARRPAGTGRLPWPQGTPQREAPGVAADATRQPPTGRAVPTGEPPPALPGRPGALPPPEGPPERADIPVRALAILLHGDRTLLTHDAVPDLVLALERGDENLRWRAADALGQLGPDASKAAPALLTALGSASWRVRSSAALALGNVGARSRKVVRRLRRLTRDRHPDVRDSAKTALIRLGLR